MARNKNRVVSCDTLELRILLLLAKRIGYSAHPKSVPLYEIAKAVHCTYEEAKERINKLKEKEIIETWVTKHPTQFKRKYYRLSKEGLQFPTKSK